VLKATIGGTSSTARATISLRQSNNQAAVMKKMLMLTRTNLRMEVLVHLALVIAEAQEKDLSK